MIAFSWLLKFTAIAIVAYIAVGFRNMEYNNSTPMPKIYGNVCLAAMGIGLVARILTLFFALNITGIGSAQVDAAIGFVAIMLALLTGVFSFLGIPLLITFIVCKSNSYEPPSWITVITGIYAVAQLWA